MEVIKAVKFKYFGDFDQLFRDFREMVEFCIDKALELNITSYAKLRKAAYDKWKQKWYPKYHTHYCHSACKIATAILKNFRKRRKKGLTDKEKPEVKGKFVKLEEMLFKFEGDKVRVVLSPRNFLTINLIVGKHQEKFVNAWKNGELDVGEVIIKKDYIVIPFKKSVKLTGTGTIMAVDVNEKNITYTIASKDAKEIIKTVRLDIYKVKRIHDEHSKKRQRIQEKLSKKPKVMKKVLIKYKGREKRRIENLLHCASKFILRDALKFSSEIVLENLKNLRNSINKRNKKLRRRLNRWNFRKLQFFIEYKAKWGRLSVSYVKAHGTSSFCPICGSKLSPNGQRLLKCKKCGYEGDRDVIATLNLLRKSGCAEIRSPRKLPDEVWLIKPDGTGELLKVYRNYLKLLKLPWERTELVYI